MKTLAAIIFSLSLFIGASSCVVFVGPKHDQGKHKGWFKNPKNPHNPAHKDPKPGAKPKAKPANKGNGKAK